MRTTARPSVQIVEDVRDDGVPPRPAALPVLEPVGQEDDGLVDGSELIIDED